MSPERAEREELTPEELEEQEGEPLPERAAMSIVVPGHGMQPLPLPLPEAPIEGGPYTP